MIISQRKVNAEAFKKYLKTNFLDNIDFMRQLILISKMEEHIESGIELYGTDYITHPEYQFDYDFTKKTNNINLKINHFIGRLIKEMSKSEGVNFDVG